MHWSVSTFIGGHVGVHGCVCVGVHVCVCVCVGVCVCVCV